MSVKSTVARTVSGTSTTGSPATNRSISSGISVESHISL